VGLGHEGEVGGFGSGFEGHDGKNLRLSLRLEGRRREGGVSTGEGFLTGLTRFTRLGRQGEGFARRTAKEGRELRGKF
jgi:hypothetical protein